MQFVMYFGWKSFFCFAEGSTREDAPVFGADRSRSRG